MLWHDGRGPPDVLAGASSSTSAPSSRASPARAARRTASRCSEAKHAFLHELPSFGVDYGNAKDAAIAESFPASDPRRAASRARRASAGADAVAVAEVEPKPGAAHVHLGDLEFDLEHGCVVIAAITSCTNTSNPQVMVAAGLLAKKAVERGLDRKPWVKSSLAPGSRVVTDYYEKAGLDPVPRGARLPHGRLRLHDLHRELRPAAGGDLARRSPRTTWSSARCSPATATSRRASTRR